jgi:hypothetical protein
VSGISGDVSGISGDVSEFSRDVSEFFGGTPLTFWDAPQILWDAPQILWNVSLTLRDVPLILWQSGIPTDTALRFHVILFLNPPMREARRDYLTRSHRGEYYFFPCIFPALLSRFLNNFTRGAAGKIYLPPGHRGGYSFFLHVLCTSV